jgi:hypothetical protein
MEKNIFVTLAVSPLKAEGKRPRFPLDEERQDQSTVLLHTFAWAEPAAPAAWQTKG